MLFEDLTSNLCFKLGKHCWECISHDTRAKTKLLTVLFKHFV